jgi:enoyl-CoA hydratase/carnithine racemase
MTPSPTHIHIDTGTDQLRCDIIDRVAVITLNRPEARNALSDALTGALRRQIHDRGRDAAVGALLVTGAGKAFCAGGDMKGMGGRAANTAPTTPDERFETMRARHHEIAGALRALRKPSIAALPGPAAGAGLAIALACDLRVAARSAFVSTGYARIGLSGDYGIAWLLTRAVGPGRARELMLLGDRIDMARAEQLGLVNRVFDDEVLHAEALALARQLAHGPAVAQRYIKDNLDEALDIDHATAIDNEAERLLRATGSDDHKEAVTAFVEKREPVFRGR